MKFTETVTRTVEVEITPELISYLNKNYFSAMNDQLPTDLQQLTKEDEHFLLEAWEEFKEEILVDFSKNILTATSDEDCKVVF